MITQDQWELVDQQYWKLLSTICTKISGDAAIASYDDNLQDLRIAAMEAIAGFSRKESKPFEEFWGTPGFNKYMKTCLWNLKNKKGAKITKRYPIHKNTVDITEFSDVLISENHDSSGGTSERSFEDHTKNFSDDHKKIIEIMMNNPNFIKPNGKINISRLSNEYGCCVAKTRKLVAEIKTKLKLEL